MWLFQLWFSQAMCQIMGLLGHIYNRKLLSQKRNAFESVLMRWMNVELVIQSEASQKEKNKYCILMHIYGI